jgi:hypothetical protein
MTKGPAELRFGTSSVTIPAGCEGHIIQGLDAVLGTIDCGTLRIGVFGPPQDLCEPCGYDARPQCKRDVPGRALVKLEQGGELSICSAEWAKGDVRLALSVQHGALTFWAKPATPTEIAVCLEIALSFRDSASAP